MYYLPPDALGAFKNTARCDLYLYLDKGGGEGDDRCYAREMECLSIMLQEGDHWLAEFAEVINGITLEAGRKFGQACLGADDLHPPGATKRLQVVHSSNTIGNESLPATCVGARRSNRTGLPGQRRRYDRGHDADGAGYQETRQNSVGL